MVNAILNRNGWKIRKIKLVEHLGERGYLRLRGKFVIKTKLPIVNKIKTITLVNSDTSRKNGESMTNLIVPRFMGIEWSRAGHIVPYKNNLSEGRDVDFSSFSATLRHEQRVVHDYLMDKVYTEDLTRIGAGGAICEMEAGYGKTYLAMGVMKSLGKKTLIVVPNSVLLNQWVETLGAVLPGVAVGEYSSRNKRDGDVVVMVINSVMSNEFVFRTGRGRSRAVRNVGWSEYMAEFGLTVWDEVHMYCTTQRIKAFRRGSVMYSLGITAEADNRADKFDRVAHAWVGPVIKCKELPGFDSGAERVVFSARVECTRYHGPEEYTQICCNVSTGMIQASLMTRQFVRDPWRIASIVADCRCLHAQGHNVFVFGDSRAFVRIMRAVFDAHRFAVETPEETGGVSSLMGGMKQQDVQRAETAKVLVCTYQFACVGLSLPAFDAMILGTPRKAQTYQTIKRIFRLSGDPSIQRIIIDYVDEETPMKRQYSKRRQVYKSDEISAEIVAREVQWNEVELADDIREMYRQIISENLDV